MKFCRVLLNKQLKLRKTFTQQEKCTIHAGLKGNKTLKQKYKEILSGKHLHHEEFFFYHREFEKNIYEKNFEIDSTFNFEEWSNNLPINFEIGCGSGNWLISKSNQNKSQSWIGIDVKIKRCISALNRVFQTCEDKNSKIICSDSTFFIENYISNSTLNSIFILFPEPWNTNIKKRIVQIDFLKLLHQKLKKNHFIFITTDDEEYKIWCIKQFEFLKNDWELIWNCKNEPDELKCEKEDGGYKKVLGQKFDFHYLKFKKI
eukprot:gene5452-9265_t